VSCKLVSCTGQSWALRREPKKGRSATAMFATRLPADCPPGQHKIVILEIGIEFVRPSISTAITVLPSKQSATRPVRPHHVPPPHVPPPNAPPSTVVTPPPAPLPSVLPATVDASSASKKRSASDDSFAALPRPAKIGRVASPPRGGQSGDHAVTEQVAACQPPPSPHVACVPSSDSPWWNAPASPWLASPWLMSPAVLNSPALWQLSAGNSPAREAQAVGPTSCNTALRFQRSSSLDELCESFVGGTMGWGTAF